MPPAQVGWSRCSRARGAAHRAAGPCRGAARGAGAARVNGVVLKRLFTEGSDVKVRPTVVPDRPRAVPGRARLGERHAGQGAGKPVDGHRAGQALQAAGRSQGDQRAGLHQRRGGAPAGRGRRGRGPRRCADRETESRLRVRYRPDHRPHRPRHGDGRCAGQRRPRPTLLATIQQIGTVYVNFTQPNAEVLRLRKPMTANQLAQGWQRTGGRSARRARRWQRAVATGQAAVQRSVGRSHARVR